MKRDARFDIDRAQRLELALEPMQALHLKRQILECGLETTCLQLNGTEPASQRTSLCNRLLHERRDRRGVFGLGTMLRLQLVAERGAQAGDARQILAEPVVEIAPD